MSSQYGREGEGGGSGLGPGASARGNGTGAQTPRGRPPAQRPSTHAAAARGSARRRGVWRAAGTIGRRRRRRRGGGGRRRRGRRGGDGRRGRGRRGGGVEVDVGHGVGEVLGAPVGRGGRARLGHEIVRVHVRRELVRHLMQHLRPDTSPLWAAEAEATGDARARALPRGRSRSGRGRGDASRASRAGSFASSLNATNCGQRHGRSRQPRGAGAPPRRAPRGARGVQGRARLHDVALGGVSARVGQRVVVSIQAPHGRKLLLHMPRDRPSAPAPPRDCGAAGRRAAGGAAGARARCRRRR